MKRFLCITLFLCIIFPVSAHALWTFEGTTEGGTGSATMDFSISGNTLTVIVNNTSPTTLNSPLNGLNAPGITGFGFNLQNDLNVVSWELLADNSTTSTPNFIDIGSDSGTGDWVLGTFLAGITLDYLPQTDNGIGGALYNPAAKGSSALGATPNYFTEATLEIVFDGDPILELGSNFSPFVRMQNVGLNGEGSLKLIPEPSTMIISGLFLLGAGVFVRRKLHRKS
jgi:hypothetical protein